MKKVIIVGATSGIGKELALRCIAAGYHTGITGRRKNLLGEISAGASDTCLISSFDVNDTSGSVVALEELTTRLGGLDLIIISSGTGDLNPSLDFSIEKQTIDTNVSGFSCVAGWAYNFFEKQGYGHLAAITSVGGLRGSRHAPAYNASKAYQINYLEGLRQKASKSKGSIFITDVRPGLVDTAMAKGEGLFWVMPVSKTAGQIFRAIRRKRKVVYVSRRWRLVALLLKILPRVCYSKM